MTAASLTVVAAGPTVTLQDGGRVGAARHGVPRSGPMDWLHHRLAARLAGVAAPDVGGATAFEVGPDGLTLTADGGDVTLAVAGPDVRTTVGEVTVAGVAVLRVPAGARVHVAPGARATWAYVVPTAPLVVARVLGSTAMHARSGLGGSLRVGDTLPLATAPAAAAAVGGRPWSAPGTGPLAILAAPQTHLLDEAARSLLTTATFRTSARFDRMGHRLDGPSLRLTTGHDIVSDGIVAGTLQVPGDGRPFVLTADHQTTGGYVKPAVLARVDLARFVQLRPGNDVRFAWTTTAAARAATAAAVAAVERCVAAPARPSSTTLAAANLIGGVTDGGTVPR